MRLIQCEQGSEEWLRARAGVVTASRFGEAISTTGGLDSRQATYVNAVLSGASEKDALALAGYKARPSAAAVAAALAGVDVETPSAVSERLALELAIERISGEPYGDTFQTFAMKRGQIEEGFARAAYEARFAVMVDEQGVVLTDDGLFGYSTDGLVGEEGLVEIKVPLDPTKTMALINGGPVDEYIHQVQGGLWVTGRKWCDLIIGFPALACLKNGNEIYVRRIYRDDDFIESMEMKLLKFAALVKQIETTLRAPFSQQQLKEAA